MGFWKRFKSSITGLFVKPEYAAQNPATTFAKKVKKPVPQMKKANVSKGAAKAQSRVARKASKPKKR